MSTISALEAEAHFAQILHRVSNGEEIIITKGEKPIARLIPERKGSVREKESAVHELQLLRSEIGKRTAGEPVLTDTEVREAISLGRAN